MKKLVLLLLIVSITQTISLAQLIFGSDIQVYSPTGSMNKNISGTPAGLSIRILKNTSDKWSFGGELGIAMYSDKSYQSTIKSKEVDVDEEDCFWTIHGLSQYTLYSTDAIRLYGEGRVGITTFFSSKTVYDNDDEIVDDEFKFHGTAFNVGLGSGLTLNIRQILKKEKGSLSLDVGINAHTGTKTNYRNINQDESAIENLNEGSYQSLTHYIAYRFGILVEL